MDRRSAASSKLHSRMARIARTAGSPRLTMAMREKSMSSARRSDGPLQRGYQFFLERSRQRDRSVVGELDQGPAGGIDHRGGPPAVASTRDRGDRLRGLVAIAREDHPAEL